jgi:uncharacterized protein (DUF2236 family)
MSTETLPQPLGPDAFMRPYLGDWRGLLVGAGTGILQLMHPAIGAGVIQHSKFFDEPYDRIFRSLPPIHESKFGGAAAPDAAARIRDYHQNIKGVDEHGQRYHALDPEVYFWAHATFVRADMTFLDLYHHRLSRAEREHLYADGRQWYRLYGISDRPMPPDLDAFDAYWDHMCADVLELTEAARWSVEAFDHPERTRLPGVPPALWRVVGSAVMAEQRLFTAAMLPPVVRDKLGLRFNRWDALRYRQRVAVLKLAHPVLNPLLLRGLGRLTTGALDRVSSTPPAGPGQGAGAPAPAPIGTARSRPGG